MEEAFLIAYYYYLVWVIITTGRDFIQLLSGWWDELTMSFNAGQLTIYAENLLPVIEGLIDEVEEYWIDQLEPDNVDVDVYVEECYTCYDTDVMFRAFSESIDGPLEDLYDLWETAVEAQYELEAIDFFE